MKIAVNTRLLRHHQLDGIGVFTHEIFSRIVKNHPQHRFYFITDHPLHFEFVYASNVQPVTVFPPTKTPALYNFWFQYRLPRVLKTIQPDIFISPDGNIPLKTPVTTLNVIHDLNFEHFPQYLPRKWRKYYRRRFPAFARKADKIITVSQHSKNDIAQTYQITREKIAVVHNAAADYFLPLSAQEQQTVREKYTAGAPYFIFVGSLHPRKNITTLLQAFEHFKNQYKTPHRLVLAGKKMWWTKEMEQTLNRLSNQKHVILTGRIENNTLNGLLASAQALVYVPWFEGFGIPLLEAFRCRTPVIYANNTAMPEVAQNAGIPVEAQNIEEITYAMHQLATDPELTQQLIDAGTQRLQHFSWEQSAEKFWQIIEQTAC
jgi:glycosyltransferase involved in cell wall biosynthesis